MYVYLVSIWGALLAADLGRSWRPDDLEQSWIFVHRMLEQSGLKFWIQAIATAEDQRLSRKCARLTSSGAWWLQLGTCEAMAQRLRAFDTSQECSFGRSAIYLPQLLGRLPF
jgi:hypothetical protein